jgi:predicted flap endonuclease-1-like 5' DNA nuclease
MNLVGQANLEQVKQELVTRYTELKKALDTSDQRIQKLEAALEKDREERIKAIEERERRLQVIERGLKEEQDAWTSQVEERDEALFDLKLELETEYNRLSDRVDNQNESVQTLNSAVKELKEKVDELQRSIGDVRITEVKVGDDLTRIKGVGPRFERALKAQGVTTYAQIASWTEEDIDRIAPLIRVKPERIQRERWVDRARELLQSSQ